MGDEFVLHKSWARREDWMNLSRMVARQRVSAKRASIHDFGNMPDGLSHLSHLSSSVDGHLIGF